jgi:simple sugar transport system substrate-binding protein
MFKNLARASVVTLAAMMAAFAATTPSAAQSAPPLKVAFVYVSPIGEAGWTYQHEQGRLAMQKALGSAVVSTAVERWPKAPTRSE